MQEQSRHRPDGHGDVVGQPVISQPFATTGRGHDVNDNGISAYRDHPERKAMDDAEQDKEAQGARQHVSAEHGRKEEVCQQVKGLPREGIQQIAGEWPHAEGGNGVAGKNGTDAGLVGTEYFLQVEGKYGYQQPETEELQEVGCNNQDIAGGDKSLFHVLGQIVIQSEAKNLGNIHVVVTEILRFALNDIKSLF